MCGKTRKVFDKMGHFGERSSTLWFRLLDKGISSSVCWSGAAAEYVGVIVCVNSFLIAYYHFCECVLLLRLLHPFIDRVLSEAQ